MGNQATLFPEPAQRLGRPPEPIIRRAMIEGVYRFELTRDWGTGKRLVICGCNPSRADHRRDDPTLWRGMSFAYSLGFSGFVMVNVHPLIASNPLELARWLEGVKGSTKAVRRNRAIVAGHCLKAEVCLAAWGNLVGPGFIASFLAAIGDVRWHCLGTNADGSPKHLMARGRHRIPDDAVLKPWRPQ